VAHGEGPEFKPQYCLKKKEKKITKVLIRNIRESEEDPLDFCGVLNMVRRSL
jgi:hypothetical protein